MPEWGDFGREKSPFSRPLRGAPFVVEGMEGSTTDRQRTTIPCPQCAVALPLDQGIGPASSRRWTCTRCGARFDAEGRPLPPLPADENGRDVTNQVIFGARVR